MASKTNIGWTQSTVNFWHGCKKVSEGCKFCYMYRDKDRFNQDPTTVIRASEKTFNQPKRWQDPRLIFVCSWSDFFIEEADAWRKDAWEVIRSTPHHTYQILTKRPERIKECLPEDWGDSGYENVWIGVSTENQKALEDRWHYLIDFPAKVKFLSIEPIIGEVNMSMAYYNPEIHKSHHESVNLSDVIDWVIIGGESGNDNGKWRYRPSELIWYKKVISFCKMNEIPVFMKQLGTHLSKEYGLADRTGSNIEEINSKNIDKVLNVFSSKSGTLVNDMISVQEFPNYYKPNKNKKNEI